MTRTAIHASDALCRCANCDAQIGSGAYLGLNGRYLCGRCIADKTVLERFMAQGSRAARTALDTMIGLSGGRVPSRSGRPPLFLP